MKVLVACEFSAIVREAFLAKGHDAWSCDLLPTERPGPHIQDDVLLHLDEGWDLMIAHPPCTHLALSGAAWFAKKRADGRQEEAVTFFLAFANAPVPRYCIENPMGIMSRRWRKPDQVIQPYYFGDEFQKTICLWLKNLPCLEHCEQDGFWQQKTHVRRGAMVTYASGRTMPAWYARLRGKGGERSRTFPGIAAAMAEQWGGEPDVKLFEDKP